MSIKKGKNIAEKAVKLRMRRGEFQILKLLIDNIIEQVKIVEDRHSQVHSAEAMVG